MHLDEDTGKWNLSTDARGKTFELGGPDVVTEEEMFDSVMECTFLQRPKVEVPLSVSMYVTLLVLFAVIVVVCTMCLLFCVL